MSKIKDRIFEIRRRISNICSKINRDPASITIVAISKGRTLEQIKEVTEAGISDIGENRVKEGVLKFTRYSVSDSSCSVKWHMVGHLQTNKVKQAVGIFDLIHSVDSLRLAIGIDKQAARINKIQDILLQISTSGETTKFGLKLKGCLEVIKKIAELKNLNIKGLMTIAPLFDAPEKTRPYFKRLRELKDEITRYSILPTPYSILSMGMTDDFEVAVEEGADMLRLGRAIFEG